MEPISLNCKRKMKNSLLIIFGVLTLLAGRIGYIQFIRGGELQVMAYEQQAQERAISPKRGTLYDSTGKYVLAVSSTVYTVTVNPTNIQSEEKEKE